MYENIIIIPYRNRKQHLDYFIEHSVPLIVKNMPNTKIIIIEQNNDELFNRGKLMNVAFKEYQNLTHNFITHDVDINPFEETIQTFYTKKLNDNQVIGIYTSCAGTLGGIIKISSLSIFKCNGFPNNYRGWGCEDKALQNRVEYYNISIQKNILNNDPNRTKYFNIFNDINDRKTDTLFTNKTTFEYNTFQTLDNDKKLNHILSSGLNNLEYNIFEKQKINDHVELIKVNI